jgi:hypothetical protein
MNESEMNILRSFEWVSKLILSFIALHVTRNEIGVSSPVLSSLEKKEARPLEIIQSASPSKEEEVKMSNLQTPQDSSG